ncbi:hypothetical protein D8674_000247 [Pyrus ussuriensis x Pyrus communis]|uniref:Uncharacterized protein n=1 Tax=Pyrus ussuriensis x Pyrus communis TaxID=2448454 RepID=A0A5N5F2Y0_9ROSA|nr:hypothetical protein D8674_000247 [Pyrus ussuriensis x Pyrus communis]
MATTTPCSTYQEFYKVLLQVEDSKNAPDDSLRKIQSLKRSGTSYGSYSGGSSSIVLRNGGCSGGSRFQRQRDFGGSSGSFCRRCNSRHFWDCRQGNRGGCFPSALPPPIPIQQVPGPSGYTQTSYGGVYHYQGDIALYYGGQYQYPHDPHQHSGYTQYPGGYAPYPTYSAGGSQWYLEGQSQNVEVASSSAGSSRQPN